MKKIILILILINTSCFAQFKVNYNDLKNQYSETRTSKIDENFEYITFFEKATTINLSFSKTNHTLITIVMHKGSGFSDEDFNGFIERYLVNFKPTRIDKKENIHVYYDEAQELLVLKSLLNEKSSIITSAVFTIDKEDINTFIKLMDLKHVKSTFKK